MRYRGPRPHLHKNLHKIPQHPILRHLGRRQYLPQHPPRCRRIVCVRLLRTFASWKRSCHTASSALRAASSSGEHRRSSTWRRGSSEGLLRSLLHLGLRCGLRSSWGPAGLFRQIVEQLSLLATELGGEDVQAVPDLGYRHALNHDCYSTSSPSPLSSLNHSAASISTTRNGTLR